MSKEVTSNKLTLTVEQRESAIKRIQKGLAGVERGYINIAADVAKLADASAFVDAGYKNIYDMCDILFGMSRGTVSNLRAIVKRFFDEKYKILPQYEHYTVTALLAMKDLSDEEITLLELSPDMSNKELREIIAGAKGESTSAIEDKEAVAESEATEDSAEAESEEEASPDREPKRLQTTWDSAHDINCSSLIPTMRNAKAQGYDFVEITVL